MPVLIQGAAPAVEVFGSIIPLSMLPLLMLTRFLIFMISEEEDSMLEHLVIIVPDLPVSRLLICLTGGRPLLLSKSCRNLILSVSGPPAAWFVPRL